MPCPGDVYIQNAASSYNAISLNSPDQIADSAVLHVGANGWFIPLGFPETIGGLSLSGNGHIDLRGATLTLNGDVQASGANAAPVIGNGILNLGDAVRGFFVDSPTKLLVSATITGGVDETLALQKTGFGRLILSGANTYAGRTLISQGALVAANNAALGDANPIAGPTTVAQQGTLQLAGTTALRETVILNPTQGGDIALLAGSGVMQGEVVLNGSQALIETLTAQDVLEIRAPISGPGGLACAGPGTIQMSGSASNTYAGSTRVASGALKLSKTAPARAIPGILSLEDSSVLLAQDSANAPQLADGVDLEIGPDATFYSQLHDETVRTLTGSGSVTLNGARLLIGAGNPDTATFKGRFTGSQGQIAKIGTGRQVLDYDYEFWDEDFFGRLVVFSGTLDVRKGFSSADAYVEPAGTLAGQGYFSNIVAQSGSTVIPTGEEMGAENITLLPGSTLRIQLGNWDFGRDITSLYANTSATIDGANLLLSLAGPVPTNDPYYLMWLNGRAAVHGTFAGLPEGSQITLNGTTLQMSYHASDGNDVALTPLPFPLKVAAVRVSGGNGDSQIDPNECTDLFITLTNLQGTPLTGVRGILRSETPGVAVSFPTAEWDSLPAHGAAANQVGFQVRSGRELAVGTTLAFTLVVSTPAHGTVSTPFTVDTGRGLAPFRFDQNGSLPLNATTVTSTNRIAGFTTNLAKVIVSVFVEHTSVSNLQLILRAPNRNGVGLTFRNGGAASHFGTGCSSDAEQLTFDDDAQVSIQDDGAPLSGSVRPLSGLFRFNGMSPVDVNGPWVLEARTTDGPLNGTLHCWSLSLTPAESAPGGGACPSCLTVITNNLTNATIASIPAFYSGSEPSIGGFVPDCALDNERIDPRHFRTHAFTNEGPDTIITVTMHRPGPEDKNRVLACAVFLDHFDPMHPCNTLLGSAGSERAGANPGFAVAVPAGARFEIAVFEGTYNNNPGRTDYELTVYGLGCLPPTLTIQPGASPQTARLNWPATSPGFHLEQAGDTPAFSIPAGPAPTLIHGRYEVTRPVPQNCSLFRLAK